MLDALRKSFAVFCESRRRVGDLAPCARRRFAHTERRNPPAARGGELPLVIPHPQSIRMLDGRPIALGQDGRSVTETVSASRGGFFEEAEHLIHGALKNAGLADRSHEATTRIVIQTLGEVTQISPPLAPQESAALAKSDQAYVIRSQPGRKATVWIIGASPLGAYYGATTLVQLFTTPRPGAAAMSPVEIRDYPDIPFRMAADWVLQWDWEVNAYDWGDGPAAFLARCKRKIDLCVAIQGQPGPLPRRPDRARPGLHDRALRENPAFRPGAEPLRPAQGRGPAILLVELGAGLLQLGPALSRAVDIEPPELS